MNDLTNREFGDYHIIRCIGSGAMAEVYLAEQRSLGRRVALKILKQDLAHDETYTRRFVREAKAIASFSHPNFVQIYQADCLDGYWYIAQEYIQGETLQQLIKRNGPLPIEQVIEILWNIASAFVKATEAGIVHRDIKPENILLGNGGEVKVADFGLARIGNETVNSSQALTEIGMTLGTPLYMSPEQAQGKNLDHRSDMYSLGITCYHALTGRPPFTGDTALAVALQHVHDSPEPLEKFRPDVPPWLVRIVKRMIEKKPENRFPAFLDLLAELRAGMRSFGYSSGLMMPSGGLSSVHLKATEKLQQILERQRPKSATKAFVRRFLTAFVVLAVVISTGLGLGYWLVSANTKPIAEPKSTTIPKKTTVTEQWVYACMLNTPDAWQSVVDFFPKEEYFWGRKAKRQLIRYYFYNGDTSHSQSIFQEFAELSDVDSEDQALGLVGLAWCAAESQDDMDIPTIFLSRFYAANVFYSDPLMIQILDAASKTVNLKKESGSAASRSAN